MWAPSQLDSRARLHYQSPIPMLDAAKIYFLAFGIVTIAGGIVGYFKAGSVISIVAGAITGILLIVAGIILPGQRELGLGVGLLTCLVLAVQFIPRLLRTRRFIPAGVMSVLSLIGLIVGIAAWIGK
jgi:uncharacterized membrane protein (UPF0136 family)